MDGQQLAALAAVVEHGSFDAAAARLHVTPSAISQRIKALEQRVGQVVVVREKACVATAAGVPLLRLAAQTALLEAEALAEMAAGRGIAANCVGGQRRLDGDVVHRGVRRLDSVLFDIRIEDQDHSARLLREGVVMGAVTTERTPVSGCRVQPLGVMRYVPVASTSYIERYLPDGFTAQAVARRRRWRGIARMHCRTCWCARCFVGTSRGRAFRPDSGRFGAAARAGRGWGMFPDSLAAPHRWTARSFECPTRTSTCRCLAVLEARQPDGRSHHRAVQSAAAELRI